MISCFLKLQCGQVNMDSHIILLICSTHFSLWMESVRLVYSVRQGIERDHTISDTFYLQAAARITLRPQAAGLLSRWRLPLARRGPTDNDLRKSKAIAPEEAIAIKIVASDFFNRAKSL
jgi:hypothetical protein